MTSLINMTSEQRIQYRRDNWRGKTFGNVENMHTKVSEKEIFMEIIPTKLSKTLKKIEESKPKTKTSKKRKPKYNWTKLNDVFDNVYTVCHRKYNKDGEPCIDFHWQDVQGFVNEYFELIKSDEKMIKYIKLKQELNIDGFFVAIGHSPETNLFKTKLKMDEERLYMLLLILQKQMLMVFFLLVM